jgi:hypothetical protein
MRFPIFQIIIGFLLAFPALIPDAICQDRVLVSSQAGACQLTVEANLEWRTLRLRAHHPQYQDCKIEKSLMLSAIRSAFVNLDPSNPAQGYSSLFIGRLIDFPWLSQYLAVSAQKDPGWDSRQGKARAQELNRYVSKILSQGEILAEIEGVTASSGYRMVGVSVEKVLVGGLREVPLYQGPMAAGRFPYDAQVWFRLEKK